MVGRRVRMLATFATAAVIFALAPATVHRLEPGRVAASPRQATPAVSVPSPTPGPGATVLPLLRSPFDGSFNMGNAFDHDLPFEFTDTNGYQLTWWGERLGGIDGHSGYDWSLPEGTPLLAAASGKVTFATQEAPFDCPILNKTVAGNIVRIAVTASNGEQFNLIYDHMSRIDVKPNQQIAEGDQVGLSGNTGCSTAPHLHFAVQRLTHTNNGKPALVDPYGWEGSLPDPWALDPRGAPSLWLWKGGQAPPLYKVRALDPNLGGSKSPVVITTVLWRGVRDDQNPNNEYVELQVDPRFAPSGAVDLTGYTLKNLEGDIYSFASGFTVQAGQPVRIYAGAGDDTATAVYWNLGRPAFSGLGDCAQLVTPAGAAYRVGFGAVTNCTAPAPLAPSVWQVNQAAGAAGDTVTVGGAGFTNATGVAFGSVYADTFSVLSDSQISVTVPAGSGSVVVSVAAGDLVSQTRPQVTFTYTQ